jgi:hypothetical protein
MTKMDAFRLYKKIDDVLIAVRVGPCAALKATLAEIVVFICCGSLMPTAG